MIMGAVALLLGPIVVVTALGGVSTTLLIVFLCGVTGILAVAVWSVIDAGRLARGMTGSSYVLQEYNRPAVYVLLSLTGLPYALGLAMFLRMHVVEAFYLPTSSMAPSLVAGDRVLTNKLGMADRTLRRGEVVVFRNPQDRRQNFIKRVIGLPGETVEISDGEIRVNGRAIVRDRISPPSNAVMPADATELLYLEQNDGARYPILMDSGDAMPPMAPVHIPPWSYFLLGDRRAKSVDSRAFGPVAHGELVGIVAYNYWPAGGWNRFGRIAPDADRRDTQP